jgi:hypothetical protein
LAFNLINPHVVEWAVQHAAEQLEEIDETQRAAIRHVVVEMQRGKFTYASAARELRKIVGLTREQASAVALFRRKLEARRGVVDDAQAGEAPFTPTEQEILLGRLANTQARIDRLVERYEGRLLKDRTETIALTESMTAAVRGQQEAWLAAQQDGLLPADQLQRWLITPDERLCAICAPMKDQTAPLGQPFTHPEANEQFLGPPIHPACRCAVSLVIAAPTEEEIREAARYFTVTVTDEHGNIIPLPEDPGRPS